MQGRPYEELDILFAKASAREFRATQVDAFDEQDTVQLAARYSLAGIHTRRPSFVPGVAKRLSATTGRDMAFESQRRA